MMKYMNKRNGKVFELVSQDEKYKTVMLQEEGQEKQTTCTTSTFKRWYKKLEEGQEMPEPMTDEQVEAQLLEQAQAVVDAEPLTSVPVCVVEEDAPEVKPEKREKKARAKKQPKDFTDLLQYIDEVAAEHGMVPYIREKQPYLRNYRINGEGPCVFNTLTTGKKIRLHCKTKLLPETVYEQMGTVNHCFDRWYDIVTDADKLFAATIISSITVPTKTK